MAFEVKQLAYPAVIGVIALALICIFFYMTGSVAARESTMFDRLHELKDYSFDQYLGGRDIFVLNLFTSAVILFASGFIAVVFSRPVISLDNWPKTSFVVACIPAVAINIYLLINWYNQVQLYNHGGTMNGRPFEPLVLPALLFIMVIATMFCIIFSLAGGRLAREALNRDLKSKQ
jgi:hypothetical protein